MSKEKEEPVLTEDQVSIKEKLTAIECDLTFDEDSTRSISPNDNWRNSELGALLDILTQAQFITRLNLYDQGIKAKETIALAKGLKGTNITTLNLEGNQIENEGEIALATNLQGTNINMLNLDYNNIGREGAESLVKNLQNTSIIMAYSLRPSGSRLEYIKLECIKAHQEALSESVSKFIKENGSVSTKMLNFYINASQAVLQNYLKEIDSEYTSGVLLKKSKEIAKNIDKFLSIFLSEAFILELGKLIVEYCGRDFELTPKMYKQLLPTPLDTTIEVVKDQEALTKALTSSLHGRAVITPGDWVHRSINSGSDSSSSSSTSTMPSSEMTYSDSVSSSSSYSSSNSYSMSSYYESAPSTTDIPLIILDDKPRGK